MNLVNVTLNGKSQTQKTTYCMILFAKISKFIEKESRLVVAGGRGRE